jgi:hypothetical protein
MRIESSVSAISWIPPEAVGGMPRIPCELGIGHARNLLRQEGDRKL